jgi:hypothetical protein
MLKLLTGDFEIDMMWTIDNYLHYNMFDGINLNIDTLIYYDWIYQKYEDL